MRSNTSITKHEIAEKLGITEGSVERNIQNLHNENPTFNPKGRFRSQMREAIAELKNCDSVQISLTPTGGYRGDLTVRFEDSKEKEFETNLELSDATRFPARIRAAATELREQGHTGSFRITHEGGILTIHRV